MTIRRGQDWGELRVPEASMEVAGTDGDLRALVERGHKGPIGLVGGDMMRTLGGTGDATRFQTDEPIPHLPIDVVRVVIDEQTQTLFVAHLIAGRIWWRGEIVAVMNAEFRGAWDVAPRGHPNDGKVDVVTVSAALGVRQRFMARSLVRTGTHVPHPLIPVVQRGAMTLEFDKPTPIELDGSTRMTARHVDVTVEADAVVVCV